MAEPGLAHGRTLGAAAAAQRSVPAPLATVAGATFWGCTCSGPTPPCMAGQAQPGLTNPTILQATTRARPRPPHLPPGATPTQQRRRQRRRRARSTLSRRCPTCPTASRATGSTMMAWCGPLTCTSRNRRWGRGTSRATHGPAPPASPPKVRLHCKQWSWQALVAVCKCNCLHGCARGC